MLRKVGIERKRMFDTMAVHRFEARAVDQAWPPTGTRMQELGNGRCMGLGIHPMDYEQRNDLSFHRTNSFHAEAPLDESEGLDKDVVR
jgi:hypothetical protein